MGCTSRNNWDHIDPVPITLELNSGSITRSSGPDFVMRPAQQNSISRAGPGQLGHSNRDAPAHNCLSNRCHSNSTSMASHQPALEVVMTKAATFSMSSSDKRPPKAGIAFLPLVTCFTTAAGLKPPSRYSSRASFSRDLSGMMTFWPPAWQAAQLPEKTAPPALTSAAKAGIAPAASTPAATSGITLVAASEKADAWIFDNGPWKAAAEPMSARKRAFM
mmetsp:Transcript_37545/g.62162  ORF Transcript_37545/g.62162 Transcript_37545/m.62162 type:complete len:219 (+) Transcript_37545:194-850(+)